MLARCFGRTHFASARVHLCARADVARPARHPLIVIHNCDRSFLLLVALVIGYAQKKNGCKKRRPLWGSSLFDFLEIAKRFAYGFYRGKGVVVFFEDLLKID